MFIVLERQLVWQGYLEIHSVLLILAYPGGLLKLEAGNLFMPIIYSSFFFTSYPNCNKWGFFFLLWIHKVLFLTSLKALIIFFLL